MLSSSARSTTRRRALAGSGAAAIALLALVTVAVTVTLGWSFEDALNAFVVSNVVMALSFGGCGAILAWHRPGNPIGWLFLTGGLLQALSAAGPPVGTLVAQQGAAEVVLRLLATIFFGAWPWAIGLCIPLALLLFPDGRPLSRRWWPVIIAVVVTAPLFVLEMAASPAPVEDGSPNPYLTLPGYDRLAPLWLVAELRTGGSYLLGLLALVLRYRRGGDTVRRQLLWLTLALAVVILAMVPWSFVAGTPVAVLFAIPLIPVAITVAVVRHQLLDIRLVVSRAVAWLVLSLGVVLAYAVLVALLQQVVTSSVGGSVVATVIVVLAAAPVLPRLQRLVDRALYGDRSDPARIVSRLGEQLATPDTGLDGVTGAIRTALRVPYVGLEGPTGTLAAAGRATTDSYALPLTYDGQETGRLVIGLRPGERRLDTADRRVLELLAAPLAVAVHATVVSSQLQESRVRLVEAREEERRRLRRELHDGVGPALTGIAFTADAAANLLAEPDRAGPLLADLRRDTRAALADVRRVAEDLRPPALDDLGLVAALRRRAETLRWREGGVPVEIELETPDLPLELPAAVEVAAYRIATEALTNAVRHSDATGIRIVVQVGPDLRVELTDDGSAREPWPEGVGIHSMRERATELGGTLVAGPTPTGGRVVAELPLEVVR